MGTMEDLRLPDFAVTSKKIDNKITNLTKGVPAAARRRFWQLHILQIPPDGEEAAPAPGGAAAAAAAAVPAGAAAAAAHGTADGAAVEALGADGPPQARLRWKKGGPLSKAFDAEVTRLCAANLPVQAKPIHEALRLRFPGLTLNKVQNKVNNDRKKFGAAWPQGPAARAATDEGEAARCAAAAAQQTRPAVLPPPSGPTLSAAAPTSEGRGRGAARASAAAAPAAAAGTGRRTRSLAARTPSEEAAGATRAPAAPPPDLDPAAPGPAAGAPRQLRPRRSTGH